MGSGAITTTSRRVPAQVSDEQYFTYTWFHVPNGLSGRRSRMPRPLVAAGAGPADMPCLPKFVFTEHQRSAHAFGVSQLPPPWS